MDPPTRAGKLVIKEAPTDDRLWVQGRGGSANKKDRPSRKESCMEWVHPTLPLVFPTGIPPAPHSYLTSLLQNLNLNLDSNRWLESLNAPRPVSNPLTLNPLELEDAPHEVSTVPCLAIPEKPLRLGKEKGHQGTLVSSRYLLRSKSVLNPAGGLGLEQPEEGRGRGRKSLISKAKNIAKKDILAGKQQSIERALRATRTLDLGSG